MELIKKLKKYEIKIRKAVNSKLQGDHRSLFKGMGIEFEDLRSYQYGDDVRTIDWNVSAKGHGTFVRKYREEMKQTVFFVLDVSASLKTGFDHTKKMETASEICGVLALSAAKDNSNVGLLCFSDQKEKYIKPERGMKHACEIILTLKKLIPESRKTDLSGAVTSLMKILKRKSVVIFISDFLDTGYRKALASLAEKHDLVLIHIVDRQEVEMPSLGIIQAENAETGEVFWINSSSATFKKMLKEKTDRQKSILTAIRRKYRADYMSITTSEDYVSALIHLFKTRNKERRGQ